MPKRCEIVDCPYSVKEGKQCKKHLFEFPKIESILAKWIKATGRTNWIPNKASAVCEIHFKPEYVSNTKVRKRLKPDAVPTEHLASSCMTDKKTEETETITDMEIAHLNTEIQNVTSIVDIETEKECISRKRKALDELKDFNVRLQRIEEENKTLKAEIKSSKKQHEENFKNQANTLMHIYEEEKKKYKERLTTKDKQLKILRIQIARQDSKLKDMLMALKNMNALSTTSYDILNNEFGEVSFHLFQNEIKNTTKSSNAKRYSDEVKRFAVTLHYHSPKAYNFCRSACTLFFYHFYRSLQILKYVHVAFEHRPILLNNIIY